MVFYSNCAQFPMQPAPLQTPCIKVCELDPVTRLCRGCARTLIEIGGWSSFDDAARQAIMAELPARLKTLHPSKWAKG